MSDVGERWRVVDRLLIPETDLDYLDALLVVERAPETTDDGSRP